MAYRCIIPIELQLDWNNASVRHQPEYHPIPLHCRATAVVLHWCPFLGPDPLTAVDLVDLVVFIGHIHHILAHFYVFVLLV